MAVGGDGTINEVARSIVHTDTALGIIPCGSGNGLARHLCIPLDPRKAISIINRACIESLDYGVINDLPFFCTCGMGFDAFISYKFAGAGKRGPMTYIENVLKEGLKYKPETYEVEIEDEKEPQKYNAFLIACANASQYGNNAYIAPKATMTDGLMDVIIMEPFTAFDAPQISIDIINKTLDKNSKIKTLRAKRIHIHRSQPGAIHYDGDPIMTGKDVDVHIEERGIRIIINPDDIETMTVLKGPAASALYGSRASHGVILITTKKADKDKLSVEYNGSFTFDTQLAKWDDVQQVYGMGNNGKYSQTATTGTNMSWGPKADDFNMTYFDGESRPFYIYPNNASDFFRTGFTTQNTAIISANSGKTGMRFSVTDMRNRDILPETNMSRDNFNLRVNTSLGKIDFDFTANYTRENVKNRPALGDSQSNVGKNLMTLANTYNQAWLKNYQTIDGDYANWNGLDQYNRNPYWDLYKNSNKSDKDVFRFTAKAIYNIDSHLKIQGTIGTDINNMNFQDYIARTTPGKSAGQLQESIFQNRTLNAELLALYNNQFGDFDVNATLGGNIYKVDNKTNILTGLGQQMKDVIAIMNYQEQSIQQNTYKKQINSLYGSASIGYDHTYYLEGTIRGDKSSTLPTSNNTYVYPSVSASWVFSEYLKNKNIINYGKFRASWAKVGSDTDPYQLALNYSTGKYSYSGFTIGMINNNTQPNKDLKPTMTTSYELGLEMKFFHNRLSLDVTYYNHTSRD